MVKSPFSFAGTLRTTKKIICYGNEITRTRYRGNKFADVPRTSEIDRLAPDICIAIRQHKLSLTIKDGYVTRSRIWVRSIQIDGGGGGGVSAIRAGVDSTWKWWTTSLGSWNLFILALSGWRENLMLFSCDISKRMRTYRVPTFIYRRICTYTCTYRDRYRALTYHT